MDHLILAPFPFKTKRLYYYANDKPISTLDIAKNLKCCTMIWTISRTGNLSKNKSLLNMEMY